MRKEIQYHALQWLKSAKYALTRPRDWAYYRSLKNLHRGKRGFVIGNGPSLKLQDLEQLRREISIASNKIYLAFDQVEWRPTYYTVVDKVLWPKIATVVDDYFDNIHLPISLTRKWPSRTHRVWRERGRAGAVPIPSPHFSRDLRHGIYGGSTVTVENIQLAVHLGLNPIYIIGCDHHYEGESDVKNNKMVKTTVANNHFIKNYREVGEAVNPAPIDSMNSAYAEMRRFSDLTGIKVYNATRGGYLDQFERVKFDDLF